MYYCNSCKQNVEPKKSLKAGFYVLWLAVVVIMRSLLKFDLLIALITAFVISVIFAGAFVRRNCPICGCPVNKVQAEKPTNS